MSLIKVVPIIGTGDSGLYQVKDNLPIASFYITESNDDVRIRLPNYMVDGANAYVRTANGKSAIIHGTSNTTSQKMYDIVSGNASAKDFVNIPANQNAYFIYYSGFWYYDD